MEALDEDDVGLLELIFTEVNSGLVKCFSEVEGKPSTTFLAKSSSENTKCTVLFSGEKVTLTGVSLVRVILLAKKATFLIFFL